MEERHWTDRMAAEKDATVGAALGLFRAVTSVVQLSVGSRFHIVHLPPCRRCRHVNTLSLYASLYDSNKQPKMTVFCVPLHSRQVCVAFPSYMSCASVDVACRASRCSSMRGRGRCIGPRYDFVGSVQSIPSGRRVAKIYAATDHATRRFGSAILS